MTRIVQTRGPGIEAEHAFAAVACHDNRIVGQLGVPLSTFFRSAAKPLQLATALHALGDPQLQPEWLAVGAASHSAEPKHVGLVEAILAHWGNKVADLRCAPHPPAHDLSASAVLRAGGVFSDLHNNCSGKHAFMLAACRAQGWALDYRAADHPLQVRNRLAIALWCGAEPAVGVDGCGVPTFHLPLGAIARSWWVIAEAMRDIDQAGALADVAAPGMGRRLHTIGWAMARHSELTSGTGRLDLAVVQAAREPMAVKVGAMGLFCLALPQRRLGIAIKIETGVTDVLGPAVEAALATFAPGAWQRPEAWPWGEVRNVAGRVVGGIALQPTKA